MATTFAYRVRDQQGKLVEGTIEGDSQNAVVGRLREMGLMPLDISEQTAGLGQTEIRLPWANKAKGKDVAVMSRQFATMINSGLSLLRALTILSEQTDSKPLKDALGAARADVEKGQSLSAALQKHPKVFNRLYISMVRAGETSGSLDRSLLRLAETLEKEVALRQKIKSAMTYPIAVFGLVVLIVSAMLLFVVPMFEELYADLGGTLPLPTRALIALSGAMTKFWFLWMPALGGAIFGFGKWKASERGSEMWDVVKLRIPIFGSLVHKTALSRFSRTLSTLMRSGVPILAALEIVRETVNNHVLATAIRDVGASVQQGTALAKPLENHKVFPPMVVQMMQVGEETGALDEMLEKIAEFYDQEVDAAVESLTSLIEPILVAVMGATVGGMVVALYMPMFNIINLIK
ncbi:MAG TPA: type II secretion system F family protein [Actinomycetota bacterium]